jgi:mRNA interferase MazF
MPPTTSYSFGDVVLVPFPFTDQSGIKKRPALVVSSQPYQDKRRDLVIVAITSQLRPRLGFGEFLVADWKGAGLLKPSVVKPVFATIEKRLVIRTLGQVTVADRQALTSALRTVLGA